MRKRSYNNEIQENNVNTEQPKREANSIMEYEGGSIMEYPEDVSGRYASTPSNKQTKNAQISMLIFYSSIIIICFSAIDLQSVPMGDVHHYLAVPEPEDKSMQYGNLDSVRTVNDYGNAEFINDGF